MAQEERFIVSWVSEWWILVFNLKTLTSNLFCFYLYESGSVLGLQIRIHKVPEYRSNLDPDPQWQPVIIMCPKKTVLIDQEKLLCDGNKTSSSVLTDITNHEPEEEEC